MNPFILQIIATVLMATALVKDKHNIKRFKIKPKEYTSMVFLWLVVFSGIAMTFTHHIDWQTLARPGYYFGFIALIVLAFLWNKLFYYFEEREELQDFEVINLTVPAVTALFAGFVFPEELNTVVVISVMISLAALYAARFEKVTFKFNNYNKLIFLMIVVMAAETVMRKVMLDVFDPTTLYFFRVTAVLILFYIFYTPKKLPKRWKVWLHAGLASLAGTIAMIIMFYGYQEIGVILTTMVFLLNPILVYLLDSYILKERIKKRNIVASIIILVAILIAAVYS